MDVREKLVELMDESDICSEGITSCIGCKYHKENAFGNPCDVRAAIADKMIANGVTVQEWISVKEQLPQENEPEGALCEDVQVLLNNGKVSVGWCNRRTKLWYHMDYGEDYFTSNDYDHTPVVAWMPLSEPPKGE